MDFSKISIALGLSGGTLSNTTPDIDISLYDLDGNFLAEEAFVGHISNGNLTLANPNDTKSWLQNFENLIGSVSISYDSIEFNQTHSLVTLSTTGYFENQSVVSNTTSYYSPIDCLGCGGEWEIE